MKQSIIGILVGIILYILLRYTFKISYDIALAIAGILVVGYFSYSIYKRKNHR